MFIDWTNKEIATLIVCLCIFGQPVCLVIYGLVGSWFDLIKEEQAKIAKINQRALARQKYLEARK